VLENGLKAESYAVDVVYNGAEGEELAAVNEYDAIILDIITYTWIYSRMENKSE